MSHGQSGKKIEHAGRHRGTSYNYDHHIAEKDSQVLRRAQDKRVVREALAEIGSPRPGEGREGSPRVS